VSVVKAQVIYTDAGEIVALGIPLPPAYDHSQPRSGPHVREGQRVADFEIPAELDYVDVVELSRRLHVDTSSKAHALKARSAPKN
jgi:hypothetical protein